MSLEATETMRASMDSCLRFISGEKTLSKEEVRYQVNEFFMAAKEIENMFDDILSKDVSKQVHKFQAQEEIELLRQEIATKDTLIAKIQEKSDEWNGRFLKLKQEQINELCAI